MNTEKKTWKFWIMSNDDVDGRYYYFRSFKVYWAYYKWLYSKERQLEKIKSYYEKCKKDTGLVKVLFGKPMPLTDIEKLIDKLSNEK